MIFRATAKHLRDHLVSTRESSNGWIDGVPAVGLRPITLTFRSPDRTLTDAEVDGAMSETRKRLAKEHRAAAAG